MKAVLAKAWPLDPVTGERIEVRLSAHGDSSIGRKINGKGGQFWAPALTQAPALRISLFDGAFQSVVSAAQAGMQISLSGPIARHWPDIDRYAWAGAKVEIYSDDPEASWPWAVAFTGRVASYSRTAQVLSLSVEIDTEPFQADILNKTYAGTGGAEGGTDLTGKPKPLVIGWAMNVEPVLIDTVNNVWQFSGYGPIEAVTDLFERGSPFPDTVPDYDDYAALVAATIAPGDWATCLDEGMIRLGAPAYGVITGDIKGHKAGTGTPRLTGSVISAIAGIAGVSSDLIDGASMAALDTAVPFPVNLVLADQIKFLDIAQRLALPCNAQAGIGLDGRLFAARIALDAYPAIEIHAGGRRKPLVIESREEFVSPPFWRTVLGANRCWRVHSAEEIAFGSALIPRGLYSAAETYREGQYVDQPDGSQWLYIATDPASSHAPPTWPTTSNAWWENLRPPLTADGLTYSDGTPIEDLRPAEPDADVTSASVPRHDPTGSAVAFTANHLGVLDAGQLPKTIQIKRMKGSVDNSAVATWTLVSQGAVSGGAVTVTDGVIEIPSGCEIPPSTEIKIKSANDWVEITSIISVTRLDAPPPTGGSSGGTTVSDNTLNSVSSTTKIALSDEMTVKTGSSGTIDFGGVLSIIAPSGIQSGLFGALMRWKYKPVGGSYSNVGASDIAQSAYAKNECDFESGICLNEAGSINVADSLTGLSSSTDYVVQLWGARGSSTPTKTISFGGSVSAMGR